MSPQTFHRISIAALVLQVVIVLTGGAVRLTGSGLGCSNWPTCEEGVIVPEAEFHTWVEYGNRLFTFLVVVSVVAAVIGAHRRVPRRDDLIWLSWGLVVGVVAQIVIGALVVVTELIPAAVSAHFLVSMALVANAVVLVKRAGEPDTPPEPLVEPIVQKLAAGIVTWGAVVLLIGTMVTGSGPHSGDPEVVDRLGFDIGQITRTHAVAVWLLGGLTVVTLIVAWRTDAPRVVIRRGEVMLALMIVQGTIGYVQYANGVPRGLVAVHLGGATLVWMAVLWFYLGLRVRPQTEPAAETAPGEAAPALSEV